MCEVSSLSTGEEKPEFNWLNNHLLIIDGHKKIKLIDVSTSSPRELKLANIEDTKICSSYSWNHDCSLLAIVINSRQLYIWTIEANIFTHIKPANRYTIDRGSRKQRAKEITAISWSRLSDRLVICYATGQLLLCGFNESSVSERFIDNSDGLLKKITLVETSESIDIFACLSVANEILVMSFEGQAILYIQADCVTEGVKFSKASRVQGLNEEGSKIMWTKIWLSCVNKDKQLMFKTVHIGSLAPSNDNAKQFDFFYEGPDSTVLLDFHWLDDFRLVVCYVDGNVDLIEFQDSSTYDLLGKRSKLVKGQLRDVSLNQSSTKDKASIGFKVYALANCEKNVERLSDTHSSSLLSMSDYFITYYKIHRKRNEVSIELVDEMDLSDQLRNIDQILVDAKWSFDSQMLAVQLNSGHILIYKASLGNNMIAINGPKVAYMSDTEEVTLLDYGTSGNTILSDVIEEKEARQDSYSTSSNSNANASILSLNFRPSLIAIGGKHVALALNNRLRFYQIEALNSTFFDEEYPTIIAGISLCSSFVAVQLKDNRLKLQSIDLIKSGRSTSPIEDTSTFGRADERYFPDPLNPETVVSFTLTENLLIYSSLRCKIYLFCLRRWAPVQTYDHRSLFDSPIRKLVVNNPSTKILCITDPVQVCASNTYLYDICTKSMIALGDNRDEFDHLLTTGQETSDSMQSVGSKTYTSNDGRVALGSDQRSLSVGVSRLNQVEDAIWDTNRGILLVDSSKVHVVTVLNYTVARDGPYAFYVGHFDIPISCRILYASQGVVSFQTSLGRVINTILPFYDDELQLTNLELQLHRIGDTEKEDDHRVSKAVSEAKLQYLRTILPIYSLSRCKEICNYLMTEEQLNIGISPDSSLKSPVWKLLASWSLFTMNLQFALMLYRRHGWIAEARLLEELIRSAGSMSLHDLREELKLFLRL